jgi:hypothetical protein
MQRLQDDETLESETSPLEVNYQSKNQFKDGRSFSIKVKDAKYDTCSDIQNQFFSNAVNQGRLEFDCDIEDQQIPIDFDFNHETSSVNEDIGAQFFSRAQDLLDDLMDMQPAFVR